jgi:RNA polymerase sigma factor (TIGR02999 family)
VQQRDANFTNRSHFFAIAAQLMRRILTDHARARLSFKRGGGQEQGNFVDPFQVRSDHPAGLLAVDDALRRLSALDVRQEKIVEMRFFGGLTTEEIAAVLGVSTRTVEREWTMARAWLHAQLKVQAIES